MAKKKTSKDPPPDCYHFDYRKRKQYLITNGKRRLIKKGDSQYREWPDLAAPAEGKG